MATYETLIYEKVEDKIFRLTLNRPEKLNAMSQKLLKELDGVLEEFESDSAASVLVIRGAGRAFCAGYDLHAFADETADHPCKQEKQCPKCDEITLDLSLHKLQIS